MLVNPKFLVIAFFLLSSVVNGYAQTATWIGAVSNQWRNGANWSTGVEPDANTDVIINFIPGNNQCTLRRTFGVGRCKSLTIGTGSFPTEFVEDDGLFVYGDLTIGANGTFTDDGGYLRVGGDWINNGTYTANSTNRRVYMIGTSQTISGSTPTTFEKLYINSGSYITLAQHITISNFAELSGTLDPTSFFVTAGNNEIDINSGGVLVVRAPTFGGNYTPGCADNRSNNATINYASTTVNQTIDHTEPYENLLISGSMVKSAGGNLSIDRDLTVSGGILDLQTFTANRNSNGGSLSLGDGTGLRIGGTNSFPNNYSSILISPSSSVEYNGGNQNLRALSYGNLTLSSSGGSITKTLPGSSFSITGNFTTSASAGTLSTTAGNTMSIAGNTNIGAGTTFNGSTFSHTIGGDWTNEGNYQGCGGTVTSTGAGSVFSGGGVNNFGNLIISGNGTIVNLNTSFSLCGNFSTIGGGSFTHASGGSGTFTMTGAGTTISGSNITYDDLIIGAGSVFTNSTLAVAGDLTATGTLTATGGTISLTGSGKTIGGAGALQFFALNVPGTITTARNLSIASDFSVGGSYTASAGQTTFNGTSTLSGTADLFNLRITSIASLTMGGSALLRISGTETLDAGYTFDSGSNIPNTVHYNSTGAQSLGLTSYNNLIVSGGNTKTPLSGFTAGGDVTIDNTTTLAGGSFTYNIRGNWVNNGTFNAGTSTVQFTGSNDTSLTGTTVFSTLAINKSTAANKLTLNNDVTAANAQITNGLLLTGANEITITATRTGNGIILGSITRTHAFGTGINYAFEGPNNFINFISAGTVSSVTVLVEKKIISGFPAGAPVNRQYTISVTGTGYDATLRLHYEQSEVNGNSEPAMTLWNDQGTGIWVNRLKSANDTGDNWVEQTGVLDLLNSWTLSDGQNVVAWTGLGLNGAWSNPANWVAISGSPGPIPTINDIAYLGTQIISLQPTITSAAQAKKVVFGDMSSIALTLGAGGSLTVQGNIEGDWSGDRTHTINIGSRTLTTFSDLELSKGITDRRIDLIISSGSVTVNGSLHQTGGANITFTGNGTLNVGENYNYVSGSFTAGSGNVTYNGINDQVIANLTYNNLNIEKVFGIASTNAIITVNGDLTLGTSGGQLALGAMLNVGGDVSIGSGTTLNTQSSTINVGGNWSVDGVYIPGTGLLNFNGTGAQSMDGSTVNDIHIDKAGGTLTLLGDVNVNGNISVLNGIVDAGTHNVTRTTVGGSATLAAGTTARFAGAGLQISNFSSFTASPSSTVEYYGTTARPIPPISFGHLVISNGGANAKSMVGPTIVQGNLTINAGATLTAPISTLSVGGNIISNGTFVTTGSTLVLTGISNTISGTINYDNVVVNGSYDLISGNANFNGHLQVSSTGDFDLRSATVTSSGDLTNSGILRSDGVVTFTGTQVQTIRLVNAVSSASTGVINFNGTVSPVLNSNSSPVFATVNINNTSPVTASQPWTVAVAMNVASGATWNAGPFTHTYLGGFNNSGTVNSSGTLSFIPTAAVNITLGNNLVTTGNVSFAGTGQINLSDNNQTFSTVEVLNTNASGITPATGWTLENLLIGAGATLHGGAGLTHTVAGRWTNNGTFTGASSNVVFTSSSGLDDISGGGASNFNNVLFNAASNLSVVSPISVTGNFSNNGLISFQSAPVTFTGSSPSVLGGTSVTVFEELDINKTGSHVQLDNDATVTQLLSLNSGQLRLNSNTLLITNPLVSSLTTAGGYIVSENTTNNSRVDWVINNDLDAHVIPFGTTGGDLIPFTFVLTSGDGGTLSVATYGTGPDNLPYPPDVTELNDGSGANNSLNTVDRFYQIDLIGATSPTANITFVATMAEVGTITDLRAQRWNSGWETPILGQISGLNTVTVSGVTQFSSWAISGNSSPLPVTLLDFTARQATDVIVLNWSTATEINNDYFEIEKSYNGKSYGVIGKLKGAVNSDDTKHYTFSDRELKKGRVFYRLKQIDLDGTYSYSPIVSLSVVGTEFADLDVRVYPNPATNTLYVVHNGPAHDFVSVSILDATGKLILRNDSVPPTESGEVQLDMSGMKAGYYIIQTVAGGKSRSFRILKAD